MVVVLCVAVVGGGGAAAAVGGCGVAAAPVQTASLRQELYSAAYPEGWAVALQSWDVSVDESKWQRRLAAKAPRPHRTGFSGFGNSSFARRT